MGASLTVFIALAMLCVGVSGCATSPGAGDGLANGYAAESPPPRQPDEPVQFQAREEAAPDAEEPSEDRVGARPEMGITQGSDRDEPAVARIPSPPPADVEPISPPPPPRDPGADVIIDALFAAIDHPDQAFPTVMRLTNLRNMSRSTDREFDAFTVRFAELLDRSGERRGISVITDDIEADAQAEPEFELTGAAYLITRQGFDQWELYLRLQYAGATWSIWEPDDPVRVLRQPMVNSPQILMGKSR